MILTVVTGTCVCFSGLTSANALQVLTSGTILVLSRWTWQVNMDRVEKDPYLTFHICTTNVVFILSHL